jgi:hypothetical protein
VFAKTKSRRALATQNRAIIALDKTIKQAWLTYDAMDWDVHELAAALADAGSPTGAVQTDALATAQADQFMVGDVALAEAQVAGDVAGELAAEQQIVNFAQQAYDRALASGDGQTIITAAGNLTSAISNLHSLQTQLQSATAAAQSTTNTAQSIAQDPTGGANVTPAAATPAVVTPTAAATALPTPANEITMHIYPSGAAANDPRALMAAASWQFRRAVA